MTVETISTIVSQERYMKPPKQFRPGMKKITKKSQKNDQEPINRETELQTITDTATNMNQIEIKLSLIEEYVQSGQLKYVTDVLNAMEHIDITLLKCLDSRIEVTKVHTIDSDSTFNSVTINVHLEIKCGSRTNGLASLHEFMHHGRHAILTHNFNDLDFFCDLARKLTEMAIDADSKIDPNHDWCPNKNIDLISLAYSIERLSKLKKHRSNNFVFGINSPFGSYDVSPVGPYKALDLFGGLVEGNEISEYNFVVKTVNFENIESKLIFLLDGSPVNVYIHDKKWIKRFNNKEIKLIKGMWIKSKYKVLKSPLTKKVVAYLLTDIHDPDKPKSK